MARISTVTFVRQASLRLAAATALVAVPFTLVEGGMEAAHANCVNNTASGSNITLTCSGTSGITLISPVDLTGGTGNNYTNNTLALGASTTLLYSTASSGAPFNGSTVIAGAGFDLTVGANNTIERRVSGIGSASVYTIEVTGDDAPAFGRKFADIKINGGSVLNNAGGTAIFFDRSSSATNVSAYIEVASGGVVEANGFVATILDNGGSSINTELVVAGSVLAANSGQTAADLGGGSDTVELRSGWNIVGKVLGGAGTDDLVLGGSTDFNFDAANVTNQASGLNGEQFIGFERVVKRGSNTVQLSRTTGGNVIDFAVEDGVLDLRTSMTATNFTVSGGRLQTAAGLNIQDLAVGTGGTVALGDTVTAATRLNVRNVTFESGSIYEVSLGAASQNSSFFGPLSTPDNITVSGTGSAVLNGGMVVPVDLDAAADYAATETFTILTATNGITGSNANGVAEFDSVQNNSALADYTLTYTRSNPALPATGVVLTRTIKNPITIGTGSGGNTGGGNTGGGNTGGGTTTTGGGTNTTTGGTRVIPDFRVPANTPNNYQAANALISFDFANNTDVMGALLPLSAQQLNDAYRSLSGLAHAEATASAAAGSRTFSELLTSVATGGGSVSSATLGGQQSLETIAAGGSTAIDTARYGADIAPAAASFGPTVWLGALGGYSRLNADGNADGYEATSYGLAGGIETSFDGRSKVGASVGYSFSNTDVSNDLQEVDTRSLHVGLYGAAGAGRLEEGFAVRGAVSYSHHWVETERNILIGTAISRTAEADYDGNTFSGDLEAKYNFAVDLGASGTTVLSPFARARFGRSQFDGFTETGAGALGLTTESNDYNSSAVAVGVAFAGDFNVGGAIWKPTLSVAYERLIGDEGGSTTSSFIGSPTSFTTLGAVESRDRVRIGSASEFAISDTTSFTFSTDSVYSEDRTDVSAKGGIKVQF